MEKKIYNIHPNKQFAVFLLDCLDTQNTESLAAVDRQTESCVERP